MGTTCIISPSKNEFSETFIQAHIERLSEPKIVLNGSYPDYQHEDSGLRYTCQTHKTRRRLLRLLPHWYYERHRREWEDSEAVIHGYISRFFERHRVGAVLAEFGPSGAEICPHARALAIPLIVHFHGHDAYHREYLKHFESQYNEMFKYASWVVSVSDDMTEQLLRLGAPKEKVVCNPCCPREDFFEVTPDYSSTIVAVGRFVETKAPHLTISAFKMLADECPDAQLVMVGDGPLREACMSLAGGLGIAARIQFPGVFDRTQVRGILARACCFVQHSITTSQGVREGTPVGVLEAAAAGLPVISTRHAGIREAVVHGTTGLLVAEKDVVGMKNCMKTLILDKGLCRTMGEKGRVHMRAHYPIDRHIRCLQELIDGVMCR